MKFIPPQSLYFDIGGGVQRNWRSKISFDKAKKYFADPDLSVASNLPKVLLEQNPINPYFQLRVGKVFTGSEESACFKKMKGLDLFFKAYFSQLKVMPNSNYPLFFVDNSSPNNLATVNFDLENKWYLYFGMGMGYSF